MKSSERINCILLGTLWTIAIVLVLDFWLYSIYNFNMFSKAHWQYVSNMQATNTPIATGFYIAITLAITACIFGLYMLFRPRFRQMLLYTPVKETSQPQTQPDNNVPSQNTAPDTSAIQRPPHLHIQKHQMTPPRPVQNTMLQPTISTPPSTQEPRYTQETKQIFESNKYTVLTPKSIQDIPLSLVALGAKETLWLGACDVSHEQMIDVMFAFKKVFTETLGDIEINLNAFIINPTDTNSVEAILDFNSVQELSDAIAKYPNIPESDDVSADNMQAFSGYIETVLTYLGNK